LLVKLGDHHSFLMEAAKSAQWSNPDPEAYKQMPLTTGSLLEGKIAYLNMPSVGSGDERTNTYFADKLHDLIDSLDQFGPKGWILDLRNNSGGNCWPMLAGIGPVLGEGKCGYFMELGGKTSGAWFYKKGKSGIGKQRITRVSRKPYQLSQKNTPVAVLTGKNTASSGEVVTVAFRGRPNTRSFGNPTAGLSTGNQNYRLKDGAQIFLTTTVYTDRTKETYGAKIRPDVEVPEGTPGAPDPVIQAAKDWLDSLR
jgi:carboxyl-terminal processing protease